MLIVQQSVKEQFVIVFQNGAEQIYKVRINFEAVIINFFWKI